MPGQQPRKGLMNEKTKKKKEGLLKFGIGIDYPLVGRKETERNQERSETEHGMVSIVKCICIPNGC